MESCFGPVKLTLDTLAGVFTLAENSNSISGITADVELIVDGAPCVLNMIKDGAAHTYQLPDSKGRNCVTTEIVTEQYGMKAVYTILQNETEPYFELFAHLETKPGVDVRVKRINLLKTDFMSTFLAEQGRENCRFWRDWHDIWTLVGSLPLTGPVLPLDRDRAFAYHAASIYGEEYKGITFMYRLPNTWMDIVEEQEGAICAYDLVDVQAKGVNTDIVSDTLYLSLGQPYTQALPKMHRVHQSRRRISEVTSHFGWNSWDYYLMDVSEEAMLENLAEIEKIPWMKEKLRYVIVDDGWSITNGYWYPNHNFPHGIEYVVAKIKEAGFVPGIWISPFMIENMLKEDYKYLKHPTDWMIHVNGKPIEQLDPTHPEVRDYIYHELRRLYNYGFRYFKTDFLVESIGCFMPYSEYYKEGATCHDPEMGIVRGMRACMQAIRAAIGEDSYWNGCATDIGSGIGLMDSSRVGGDIRPFWTRVANQAGSVINHFHLHGNTFLNDPDFTIVRGSETFDVEMLDVPLVSPHEFAIDSFQGGPIFNADDARTWAGLIILSGGMVNLGDRLKGLNETGLNILKTIFEYGGGKACVPIDLERSVPSILFREEKDYYLLGLFNWDNTESISLEVTAEMGVPLPADGVVTDIWKEQQLHLKNGKLAADLPAHKSLLVKWDKK